MKKRKNINYDKVIDGRFSVFFVIIVLLFSVVFCRIFYVMIIHNNLYNEKLVSLTYTKVSGSSSPRGRIYDRNYKVIVDNKSLKTITYKKNKGVSSKDMIMVAYKVVPYIELDVSKLTELAKREFYYAKYPDVCDKLVTSKEVEMVKQRKITSRELEEMKIKRISNDIINSFSSNDLEAAYLYYLMNRGYAYEEKIIKSDVTDQEYAFISENNDKLHGFNTRLDWERVYPYGDTLKSILGTVSSSSQGIPAEDKDYYLNLGYSLNDRIGLSYLEKQYEKYLRGDKSLYEVLSSHETRLINEGNRGRDIVLSIDIELQQEVEKIISEHVIRAKGEPNTTYYDHSSVIIQEPNTGEILAMASKKLVNGEIVDNITSVLTSPITPGSVVKGASMLVGYNTGVIKIGEVMYDECVKIAGAPKKCSSVNNLGSIDDITALAKSSNVYQFKTAIRVNGQEYSNGMRLNFNQEAFDTYRDMYRSFGLGQKTEIDLPVESNGYSSKDVNAGNLLDYVMGQYETYTPIQLSQYISTIANGGYRLRPHLLKEVRFSSDDDNIGELDFVVDKKILNRISSDALYMQRVREGFYAVMHMSGGYGRGYIDDKMNSAGKTGTSQSFIDTDNDGIIDTETITSSFVGYLPSDNPKMSIMVTSPNSSHPNSEIDYASLVTLRITKDVTNKYYELYGL